MTRRRRIAAPAFAALAAAACIDFVEPERVAQRPTALQVSLRIVDDTARLCPNARCVPIGTADLTPATLIDTGSALAWVQATLDPGTDPGGDPRPVLDDRLGLAGFTLLPFDSADDTGVRRYRARWFTADDGVTTPVTLAPPDVALTATPDTVARWPLVWTDDPDTLTIEPGADLRLTLRKPTDPLVPTPTIRNWNLELSSASGRVRIGADGVPPAVLPVPASFLPPPANDTIAARLTVLAATMLVFPDYIVTLIVDVNLSWLVRITPADTTTGLR
ncbi:MAG: hypothetical protein ACRELD_04630 [Longimicrobiales bacterium]